MQPLAPFFIFSLPRSRSAWMRHFLAYGPKRVTHDLAIRCESVDDFVSAFAPGGFDGTCETDFAPAWRLLRKTLPEARVLTIRRPIDEVIESLLRIAPEFNHLSRLHELDETLNSLESSGWAKRYEFEQLRSGHVCKEIFEQTLGLEFDWNWWGNLDGINIQVDLVALAANVAPFVDSYTKLAQSLVTQISSMSSAGLQ